MTVRELNRDQLIQLKQNFLADNLPSVSWGELADADEIVTDDMVFSEYATTDFTEEDF